MRACVFDGNDRVVSNFLKFKTNCLSKIVFIIILVTIRGTTFTLVDVTLSRVFLRKPQMNLKIEVENSCF